MRLPRIKRLIQLMDQLQSSRGHTSNSLASICGVARRTIFRDLETLRSAGVPIEFDTVDQIYRIARSSFLPPTNFTPQEALALMVLCQELGDQDGLPLLRDARSAALKLESSLPIVIREYLRDVSRAVEIQMPTTNPLIDGEQVFQQLLAAFDAKLSVRIRYDSFSEAEVIDTLLSPYRLLFSRRSWYVIGRSSIHRATRTFNVARILKATSNGEHFTLPGAFSVDRYLGNAWHLIPEPGPDKEVHLRFQPLVARNVAEVAWHKTQQATLADDGTLDFRVTVSGLNEISWWILGYGDQVEVIAPVELRELVAARCRKAAQQYGDRADA